MLGMKKIILTIFLIACPVTAHAWIGKVVDVIDGDTIRVFNAGTGQIKVRMYGIDAPERGQPNGGEAKSWLRLIVAGGVVEIDPTGEDPYGNTVGIVWQGEQNVNQEMLQAGYAWVYRSYCDKPFCEYWLTLEGEARQKKTGLWQEGNPVPPWKWRRINND